MNFDVILVYLIDLGIAWKCYLLVVIVIVFPVEHVIKFIVSDSRCTS